MKTRLPAFSGRSEAGCATDSPTTDRPGGEAARRDPERLDCYLVRLGWAPSRRAARELIARDRVRVNGRRHDKGEPIAPGDSVEVVEVREQATIAPNPQLTVEILFADSAVIVADKPPLMPCHPLRPDERATVMNAIVAAYPEVARVGDKPLEGGLVHRLDNGTSGGLIIARNHEALAALRESLRAGRIRRRYRALVTGRIDEAIAIATPIAHHAKNPRKMVVIDRRAGSSVTPVSARYRSSPRSAITEVGVISHEAGFTLVQVTPRTGSRHQIRVHLASIRHPLAGDELYGGRPVPGLDEGRFWLHLAELEFESPCGTSVRVSTPLPRDLTDSLRRIR